MDIYQHFRIEERPFIDQVLSWKESVETYYESKLTDFLDPREQWIFQSIIGNQSDINLHFFGGLEQTERKRAILSPYYENITEEHFQIDLLQANYAQRFVQLSHRDVLGALMSQGIQRKKIGDLFVEDGSIQIVVDQSISSFLQLHLTQIKRANVHFKHVDISNLQIAKQNWEETLSTVSSLRLDAIIKEIYNISRQKASEFITRGAIKVNFRIVENPAFQMEEGDMISFQKKGRSKIVKIEGKTKKDKWRITTAMLK
ncbi:YlmH family RNA-binding protein [Salirhabdus sp. Marseille-P4669]|uniref:YlmH family RNA-binding protein n=1 Tax=Salirhabdus sp. Marseille-P4669 TaxID=2042310 RepID=UPI000C7B6170|nr:RNA-binding protein [Salirhabdus sp. Marseille-P4669]